MESVYTRVFSRKVENGVEERQHWYDFCSKKTKFSSNLRWDENSEILTFIQDDQGSSIYPCEKSIRDTYINEVENSRAKVIKVAFQPGTDTLRFFMDENSLENLQEKNLVMIPTRPRDQTLKYVESNDVHGYPIVLIVEADTFASRTFEMCYNRKSLYFLVLPHRRGVPFAREVGYTFAKVLGSQRIFFLDDDVTIARYDGVPVSFKDAMLVMEEVMERLQVAVVATRSSRHKRSGKKVHYVSYGTRVDFRFVCLDINACAGVNFTAKISRKLTRREWNNILTIRNDNTHALRSEVQQTFFQGEDFGFCERLTAKSEMLFNSAVINSLYASNAINSVAGTVESDGGAPYPDSILKTFDKEEVNYHIAELFSDDDEHETDDEDEVKRLDGDDSGYDTKDEVLQESFVLLIGWTQMYMPPSGRRLHWSKRCGGRRRKWELVFVDEWNLPPCQNCCRITE